MKRPFFAVMKATAHAFKKVSALAHKVLTAMAVPSTATLYGSAVAAKVALLSTANGILDTAMSSKDGAKQKNSDCIKQSVLVHTALKNVIIPVNIVANGDKPTIELSGFPASLEPMPVDIPAQAVIKKINDGKTPDSAHIILTHAVPGADRYKVQLSPMPITGVRVVYTDNVESSLRKLDVVSGLTHSVEVQMRVLAGNVHGWGIPSTPVPFTPR
ncbi:MAG TPA: fibronectin type III domain-containing protein [Bacteroidia bacterium]